MRKLIFVLVLLLPAALCAAEPELAVTAPTTLTGLPVELEVTLSGAETQQVTVEIGGRQVGAQSVAAGANALSFEDPELGAGTHQVVVKSAALAAETRLRLLPGWLSVLPPLVAICLALITRDVLISLFLGIFGGGMILFDWNPFIAFARTIDQFVITSITNPGQASIVIFTILLGGMVGLITKNGGTHGIVELLKPYATTSRRGQLATWALGVLVFFDDYANTLIVGPTMRPITDKLRISREKLAYIVDSTAAPVVCLFPISTWVGFEIGLIGAAFADIGLANDPYTTFIATIPYRFYPIFALVLVGTLAISKLDFGPMRRAEERAREHGLLLEEGATPIADYTSKDVEPPEGIPKRAINAFLPILTVISMTALGLYLTGKAGLPAGDTATFRTILANANSTQALLWASLSGVLMAMFLPLVQKLLSIRQTMEAMMAGFKAMFMALVVLVLAWSLSAVCQQLHTADYLVGLTSGSVTPAWLPALTFVLSAATAFATGSSWGTMGILEPLVIPICHSLSLAAGHSLGDESYMTFMLMSIAAVLAGSIWGDHCSPISDTTILSSMATGCDHIAHVRTQLPYALTVGLIGIAVGSIPTAFGMPVWISVVGGALLVVGGVLALGRWTGQETGRVMSSLSDFERYPLLFGPSPVHPLPRLGKFLGGEVAIWAKREDCNSGIAYGGNKVRKLEYLVAEAIDQGCDTLVSIGGIQSNHTRQVTGVAAHVGMKAVTVQEAWVDWPDVVYDKVGNIQLSRIMGGDVRLDSAGFDIGVRDSWQRALESVEEAGGKPYPIPAGASDHPLGGLGFANWAREVAQQEDELGIFFDTVIVCTVTGSTHAGMIAGFALEGRGRKVIGIDASATLDKTRAQVTRIANFTADAIGLGRPLRADEIILVDGYNAGVYGIPDAPTIEAIKTCGRLEGMLTDPVYEGKSMAGMMGLIRSGEIAAGSTVLYAHLGGQPALSAYAGVL